MSAVQCLGCANLDLQTHKKHAAEGLGRCPSDPVGTFVNIKLQRDCKKFKAVDGEVLAKRMEWAKKL